MACSPRRRIPFASVASRIGDAARPGRVDASPRSLTVATTARTTRFCRTRRRRSSARCPSLTVRRALRLPLAPTPPASTASRPAFRDDREPPLSGAGVIRLYDKSEFWKREFLRRGLDRSLVICPSGRPLHLLRRHAGLVPGIHVFPRSRWRVDGRGIGERKRRRPSDGCVRP